MSDKNTKSSLTSIIGPGILVAATGVGAGDLVTAGIAGSEIGTTILWAALVGAILKWCLTEGLARWQLATGTSLLEGWVQHFGIWLQWTFMLYFLVWSFAVGGAMVNACGVAGAGLIPFGDIETSKIIWGIIHSAIGFLLVWKGGYKLFEKMMSVFIGVMFIAVVLTAVLIAPEISQILKGLLIPVIPKGGTSWTLGVLGGVGGTVTLLSYGYWIKEKDREGEKGIRISRIDLAAGYSLTAIFGISMVIIGSQITVQGSGSMVALQMSAQLENALGTFGKWIFLIGFWGAVFSSLLGVWQGVPYIFADFLRIRSGEKEIRYLRSSRAYKGFLIALAVVPLILLWVSFRHIQLMYAVMGAFFMPLLALTLLIMNNNKQWVGEKNNNGLIINGLLVLTLVFFSYTGATEVWNRLG